MSTLQKLHPSKSTYTRGTIIRYTKRRVCIVTTSNSGIGKEITRALSRMSAKVVMPIRSQERSKDARAQIVDKTGNPEIHLINHDQTPTDSIREFADEFKKKHGRLDILVNRRVPW